MSTHSQAGALPVSSILLCKIPSFVGKSSSNPRKSRTHYPSFGFYHLVHCGKKVRWHKCLHVLRPHFEYKAVHIFVNCRFILALYRVLIIISFYCTAISFHTQYTYISNHVKVIISGDVPSRRISFKRATYSRFSGLQRFFTRPSSALVVDRGHSFSFRAKNTTCCKPWELNFISHKEYN